MNYEHYKIFCTVCRLRNMTKAAEELLSTQPAVSRVIQGMEAELGCHLFIRSKSGVELTREGQNLYDMLKTPCNLLSRVDDDLHHTAGLNVETIHIGTTNTALQCFLFSFLTEFRRENPHINLKLYTGSSSRMITRLLNGEIDLVFNTTPFSGAQSLSVKAACDFEDVIVAGNAFEKLKDQEQSLSDLCDYPFILLSKGMQYRQFCDDLFMRHDIHISPAIEADSSGLIVPMVEHNWGVAFVPEKMAEEAIRKGSIVKIRLREAIPTRQVTMVLDPERPMPKAVRAIYSKLMK